MEHMGILGANLQQQHAHVEPISFGIDHILSNVERSCMLELRTHQSDYGNTAYSDSGNGVASGYVSGNSGCNVAVGSSGMAYHMNMYMTTNGTNNATNAAGIIRVPAHRPLSSGNASQVSGTINNLRTLTFPWMESNRRYTKDRFTGRN